MKYGVYRSRMLIINPYTKKDAIFKSKKEAFDLCKELNAHNAGFFVAIVYNKPKMEAK